MNLISFLTTQIPEILERPCPCVISMATRFREDIGMDDIDIICVELAVEDEYGVVFEGDTLINTVGELCNFIRVKASVTDRTAERRCKAYI